MKNLSNLSPTVVGTLVAGAAGSHLAAVEDLAAPEDLPAVKDPDAVEDPTAVEHPAAVVGHPAAVVVHVPSAVAAFKLEADRSAYIPGVARWRSA